METEKVQYVLDSPMALHWEVKGLVPIEIPSRLHLSMECPVANA